jgi:pimeloyl-ACP methyl ester carboxylesterase
VAEQFDQSPSLSEDEAAGDYVPHLPARDEVPDAWADAVLSFLADVSEDEASHGAGFPNICACEFLGQTDKPAEAFINRDPELWYSTPSPQEMGPENYADLWRALRDPAVVHAMAEDYRAGLGIDRDHDAADRDTGRQVRCPTLLLQAAEDDLDIHGDPVAIWSPWVSQTLERHLIPSGHHQAEQAPTEVAEAVLAFLDN